MKTSSDKTKKKRLDEIIMASAVEQENTLLLIKSINEACVKDKPENLNDYFHGDE